MVQPGIGGLDTPRTNVGDATYLGRQPDFDISQELSFQSPSKDGNLLQQLRNGNRPTLKTPRGNKGPLTDRVNLPGGNEFTPLLKSATRNSARRYGVGKENANGRATPNFLGRIDEDMTPMPAGETSMYVGSRNTSSIEHTPLPEVDSSSIASTPLVMRRRDTGKGPLEDGNQLSLREQEHVIDKIEKENFGLKLKIHFLEDALRKAGPGFSEAALKENTELKVDKVTMQRELQKYKKHLTSAEKDLETYRQQILEVQEKAKKKYANEDQRAELERLRQVLEDKESEVDELQRRVEAEQEQHDKIENLQDEVGDLELELRRKDDIISHHEDEIEDLKDKVAEFEEQLKASQRRMLELEERAQDAERLDEAKDTIEDLESNVRRLEQQVDDLKEKVQDAISEKERAEGDLEELQEEMANKSVVTKGLSRQVEEKLARLQSEADKARQECEAMEEERELQQKEIDNLRAKLKEAREERDEADRLRLSLKAQVDDQHGSQRKELDQIRSQLKEVERERDDGDRIRSSLEAKLKQAYSDLNLRTDEKNLLQIRHDALTNESISLQREVSNLQQLVAELEHSLEQEQQHALSIERDLQSQYKDELNRLNDEISDLQAECREKDNLYDNDSEKWETERHRLEAERNVAEERAAGLQKSIDKLRDTEGALSTKEAKLKEALQSETERHKQEELMLKVQIEQLRQDLNARQAMLEDLRNELSAVKDDLRQSQRDYQTQHEKVEALEDEVEVLQATIDEESEKARHELQQSQQECDRLKQQLRSVQTQAESARVSNTASQESTKQTNETITRLRSQLTDANDKATQLTKERKTLQDRSAKLEVDLRNVRDSLEETNAARDELEAEINALKGHGEDTVKLDQERLDLRLAKTKLDAELRRLKEENKVLAERKQEVERSLENEIEKAAAEEDRLGDEIRQLQARLRQSTDNQELANLRRTIREMERRVQDYEAQLATSQAPVQNIEGNSELSFLHKEISAARQRELDQLKHEASQKETIKTLKKQIADLERKAHEAALDRLISSSPSGGSAQNSEISELRHQLTSATESVRDLKKSLREAERKASKSAQELQTHLDELEDEKLLLEQALDDAQAAAEESAAAHEEALNKYKTKMDRYKRERDQLATAIREQQNNNSNHSGLSEMSLEERRDLHKMLRESQLAADKLDRELREHREALEEVMDVEVSLRKKLERARNERSAYRASAEKLQKDVKKLKAEKDRAVAEASVAAEERMALARTTSCRNGVDTDAIIRAAEAAEKRHEKEIRGMVMQMEWFKACWDREAKLRSDAAFAKRYLLLEVQIRDACNKADLAIINRIRAELNPHNRSALSQLSSVRRSQLGDDGDGALVIRGAQKTVPPATKLKRMVTAVRFIIRMQIGAKAWQKHEKIRQKLADCVDEMEREERIKKMKEQWQKQVKKNTSSPKTSSRGVLG
ncbi:hypothetical protein QBC35DRAFT_505917 [Podospora australis]|uniref:Uncharacterized protein n=1 Tax=Podospora australis TaxID=1536484 RepID=A0AAN6WMP2_9PEZI|nr:hypothetical protein QBC35DRAFT_505917 [Podospora australis]